MWYKLKRILIYPDGVTEKQVRPISRYGYDFRNKSINQINTDGWTVQSWTIAFDANWVYRSWWTANVVITKPIPNNISNARKIIISMWNIMASASSSFFALWENASTSISYFTWLTLDTNQNRYDIWIWWTIYYNSWLSAGTYDTSLTLDLVNKTYVLSSSWTTLKTGTITDTEVSNIRTKLQYMVVYIWKSASTSTRVEDINLKIEY